METRQWWFKPPVSYQFNLSTNEYTNNFIQSTFKTIRHVSILSGHHQGALFLAKVLLQHSQFSSYLQTRCSGSISCCVRMCCGAVARCASYAENQPLITQYKTHTWPLLHNTFLHNMICCHNTSLANTN